MRRDRASGFATFTACALVLGLAGCGARRPATGPTYGVYSGAFRATDVPDVRFRVWLFARTPGRLHAEILGPAGGTRVVIDGGNGNLAVTLVSEGESYVGPADPEGVASALGLRVSLDDLVTAFVAGEQSAASALPFLRDPLSGAGLPRRFEAQAGGRVLMLELRSERPLAVPAESLGTGLPPGGTTLRPLRELRGGPWEPPPKMVFP